MENPYDVPHMVEQVIRYSDGTETVIKYRGVVVDGVLVSEKVADEVKDEPEKVEELPEVAPVEEATE